MWRRFEPEIQGLVIITLILIGVASFVGFLVALESLPGSCPPYRRIAAIINPGYVITCELFRTRWE